MKFDYLVVGSGFYGLTFARTAAEEGSRVLVVDKRNHIGGNCYTEKIEGIDVHKYGPHIFHTNDLDIWRFVNRFSKFNNYQHRIKVNFKGIVYSFPVNLMTLHQLWGITSPDQAKEKIDSVRVFCEGSESLESWSLSQVGQEIYDVFIKGYTTKQWGKDPKYLPSSIIKRLPIRLDYNDNYYNDIYQGIPIDGYTKLFENMLDHKNIKVETNVDFFSNKEYLMKSSSTLVYSGKIDEFYEYRFGRLDYRSLDFKISVMEGNYQGCSIVNYTDKDVPFTRSVEHKYFTQNSSNKTVVTWEFPQSYSEGSIPYYPINDDTNNETYLKYKKLNKDDRIIFGGRLGSYRYMDMHQVIASAIKAVKSLKKTSLE